MMLNAHIGGLGGQFDHRRYRKQTNYRLDGLGYSIAVRKWTGMSSPRSVLWKLHVPIHATYLHVLLCL